MNSLFKGIYIPQKIEWLFLLLGVIPIIWSSTRVIFETGFWAVFIFLGSMVVTNFSKNMNEKYNKNVKRKRSHMRRHKNIVYQEYQITKFQYDLNANFTMFKFVISLISIVVLALIGTYGGSSNQFKGFVFAFFINLFLIPMLSMLREAFLYDCVYSEKAKSNLILKGYEKVKFMFKNMVTSFYIDRTGKKRVIKGTIVMLVFIFLIIIAVAFRLGVYKY